MIFAVNIMRKFEYNKYIEKRKEEKIMKIRYFDNAATTRVKDEVLNEMLPYFSEQYGNPSSLYSIGRSAKKENILLHPK